MRKRPASSSAASRSGEEGAGAGAASPGIKKRSSIAGYVSPGMQPDGDVLERAKRLTTEEVHKLCAGAIMQQASCEMGIQLAELFPRPPGAFRRVTHGFQKYSLPPHEVKRRHAHFNARRLEKLAAVMTRREELIGKKRAADADLATSGGVGTTGRSHKQIADAVVGSAVVNEERRQRKMGNARERIETVLNNENTFLVAQRHKFDASCVALVQKDQDVIQNKLAERRERERLQRRKADERALIKSERDRRLEEKTSQAVAKFHERDARVQIVLESKSAGLAAKRAADKERARFRVKVREESNARYSARTDFLVTRMKDKEGKLEEEEQRKAGERLSRREEKRLRAMDKLENVARMRRQNDYERELMAQKIKAGSYRAKTSTELQDALHAERGRVRKRHIIAKHEARAGKVFEKDITPGPGEYQIASALSTFGARIGRENPKSDIEWIMLRAAELPGPDAYQSSVYKPTGPAPRFSTAIVPSDIEWKIMRAPLTPGPGQYAAPIDKYESDTPAVHFSNFRPKSEIDWIIHRASETPGPSSYNLSGPETTLVPITLKDMAVKAGTKFSPGGRQRRGAPNAEYMHMDRQTQSTGALESAGGASGSAGAKRSGGWVGL